jgi:hypothetical protein
VDAIRYPTTIQETRCTFPVEAPITGKAVATMVWSTTARNIGSMIEGSTVRTADRFVVVRTRESLVGSNCIPDI